MNWSPRVGVVVGFLAWHAWRFFKTSYRLFVKGFLTRLASVWSGLSVIAWACTLWNVSFSGWNTHWDPFLYILILCLQCAREQQVTRRYWLRSAAAWFYNQIFFIALFINSGQQFYRVSLKRNRTRSDLYSNILNQVPSTAEEHARLNRLNKTRFAISRRHHVCQKAKYVFPHHNDQ